MFLGFLVWNEYFLGYFSILKNVCFKYNISFLQAVQKNAPLRVSFKYAIAVLKFREKSFVESSMWMFLQIFSVLNIF